MKKFILPFCLLLLLFSSKQTHATCGPPVFNGTIPAAPASGQNVSIINEATFCSGSCGRMNVNITWLGPFDVLVESFHCLGMLTFICTSTDTTALGSLPGGVYTVHYYVYESGDCLNFTNTDSLVFNFTVSGGGCPAPVASFNSNVNQFTVNFSDLSTSTGGGTTWLWSFGDGGTSTLQNPSHSYSPAGTYQVCLTVTDSCGSDTDCDSVLVTCVEPIADFSSVANQLTVNFTDASVLSSGGTTWFWNFGDGGSSILQNPSHVYATSGDYVVCLTVSDSCGSDTECDTVSVSCTIPTASFTFNGNQAVYNFTNTSTGGTSFAWDFGDGNTSPVENPQHIYLSDGIYIVCLTVTDSCGSDSICDSVQVILSSTEKAEQDFQLQIFPNPANDVFVVTGELQGAGTLVMINELGVEVMRMTVAGKFSNEINVRNLPAGIYLLRCESGMVVRNSRVVVLK